MNPFDNIKEPTPRIGARPHRIGDVPDWIIRYDENNYQSGAGKAVREVLKINLDLREALSLQQEINQKLEKIIEYAFVAGRSKTTWEQFKMDHNL
jgi:hypothetical protein